MLSRRNHTIFILRYASVNAILVNQIVIERTSIFFILPSTSVHRLGQQAKATEDNNMNVSVIKQRVIGVTKSVNYNVTWRIGDGNLRSRKRNARICGGCRPRNAMPSYYCCWIVVRASSSANRGIITRSTRNETSRTAVVSGVSSKNFTETFVWLVSHPSTACSHPRHARTQ